ncbi:MAG: hypothetical protein ABIP94_24485 [Planctomycetota bacterium]
MDDSNSDYPSGPWTGYYLERGRRHRQDLDLHFSKGVLTGGVPDGIGPFSVSGSYGSGDGEVRWTKRYLRLHRVSYRGFREGKGIWGTWEIPPFSRSGFHIWPVGAGEAANEQAENEQEVVESVPTTVPKTAPTQVPSR